MLTVDCIFAAALAKEDNSDQDMIEMIASEVATLSNQLKELEEKLKVLAFHACTS